MRFPVVLLGAAVALLALPASADEPCYPNPLRAAHVPAVVPALPSDVRAAVVPNEIGLQRRCLEGEASVSPRAEFAPASPRIATVGPNRVVVPSTSPGGAELLPGLVATRRFSGAAGSLSPEPPAAAGFTLGAVRLTP